MGITVPIIVKDPEVTEYHDLPSVERISVEETCFLDGPVSDRVAVLDLDEKSGQLRQGARFARSDDGKGGEYVLPSGDDPAKTGLAADDPSFTALSVFGTVYKVLGLAEDADALGRRVDWGFDGPQLLVVPRAGDWRNAFYQRESRSLQFFSFASQAGKQIRTAHSQDIVAHETAHAVLDGIAPDLYDATLPESLAIHEAVADLTAALCAFRSRQLAQYVLRRERGSVKRTSAFSGLAEQFAGELGNRPYLRDLLNDHQLADVDATDPHALSEVLSGALYKMTLELHDSLREEGVTEKGLRPSLAPAEEARQEAADGEYWAMQASPRPEEPFDLRAAQKALWLASDRLKRLLFRGLDYLPPGEVSFADFGRAMLAADAASHPRSGEQRTWLAAELVRRGVVRRAAELETSVPPELERAVQEADLEALIESDWAAYEFANRYRGTLRIPDGPFRVWPRLRVCKRYYHRDGGPDTRRECEECLLKIGWSTVEDQGVELGGTRRRRTTGGTTLAIDLGERRVRAHLCTEGSGLSRQVRSAFLQRVFATRRVAPATGWGTELDRRGFGGPYYEVRNGVLRMRATAAMLEDEEA